MAQRRSKINGLDISDQCFIDYNYDGKLVLPPLLSLSEVDFVFLMIKSSTNFLGQAKRVKEQFPQQMEHSLQRI